jgi:hypothetical protein
MRWLSRPRCWITLLLGIAVALLAHEWPESPRTVVRCEHNCWDLTFAPDSSMLAALEHEPGLHQEARIRVWDTATGKLLHCFEHGRRVYSRRVVFAPDSKSLAVVDAGEVTQWDLQQGVAVARYAHPSWSINPDHHREILFAPDGRWLLHDATEGRVYDVETGHIVQDYHQRWPERKLAVYGGCVAALVHGNVKTFDPLTGAEIGEFPAVAKQIPFGRTYMKLSADGTHGVYYSTNNEWVVYNAIAGRQHSLKLNEDDLLGVYHSGDNALVAISKRNAHPGTVDLVRRYLQGRPGSEVIVFDTATGEQVGAPMRGSELCCFAPNGNTLAIADIDHRIVLWDWPPSIRWPLMVAMAAAMMLLSLGVSEWWSRRRSAGTVPTNGPSKEAPTR